MSERILKGVLHNAPENVILITVSDKVRTETLKKIYNMLLRFFGNVRRVTTRLPNLWRRMKRKVVKYYL